MGGVETVKSTGLVIRVPHGRRALLPEEGDRARLQNVLHYFIGTMSKRYTSVSEKNVFNICSVEKF
jgi:hypothetical protein